MKRICTVLILLCMLVGCSAREQIKLPREYSDLSFIPQSRQKVFTEGKYYMDTLNQSTGYLAMQYYGLAVDERGMYITTDNNIDAPGLYLVTETSAEDIKQHLDTLFTPALSSKLWSLYFTEYNGMGAIIDRSVGHGFQDSVSVYTVHRMDTDAIEYTEKRYYFYQGANESDRDYAARKTELTNPVVTETYDVALQRSMMQWKTDSYEWGVYNE